MITRKGSDTDITMEDMQTNNKSNDEKKLSPSFFMQLPNDLKLYQVLPFFTHSTLTAFAQTSKENYMLAVFGLILTSAVGGEPESYKQADETKLSAIANLKRHPELLFKIGTVIDHFGRKINASPYRIFLGAGDVWALKQIHEEIIAKMATEARAQAEAQAKTEFYTQFPDYNGPWPLDPNMPEEALYDKRNKEQIAEVSAQLKIIVEKITADPCTHGFATNDETTKAVADLCKIFVPKNGEIIKTGLHFPLGILKKIFSVYDTQFDPWSGAQLAFFSREVIGGVETALTAVDGQCVKNGLANLDMKTGPDRRDGLSCRHPKGIPENLASLAGKLGRTMFVDPYNGYSCVVSSTRGRFNWFDKSGGGAAVGGWAPARCWALVRRVCGVENFWRTKAETYGSYCAAMQRDVNTPYRP